ncbi:HAD hydrolase-like protein [Brevibacillus humidisoli]|uniref:HAD family hydrolase n=1 Tax=Brevibacillus humidisoli TaxID=2895522 RepID=UPI001E45899C|nr:HAD family hydrolase [Brevibacillus humidisoli]UFJ41384.1 HAD hydrolase-like protein [Brevibacillus humidisoli]
MKKWISFDLDGTLMQNPFGKAVFPEVAAIAAKHLGRPYDTTAALVAEHERRFAARQWVAAYDWDDIVRQLFRRLGLSVEIDIAALVTAYAVHPYSYLLEETVIHVLEQLRERGYSLAAVTNGFRKYQFPVMEALGLAEQFERIITPEMVGCAKPETEILRPLQLEGEIVAHIGDRLDHDVQLANRVDTLSVWIYRRLPKEAVSLAPQTRASHPTVIAACEQKWAAENRRNEFTALSPEWTPKIVIHSLQELLLCL